MIIRKILASFLIILFVLVSIPALFLFGLKTTVFNPNFYDKEATEHIQEFISEIGASEVIKDKDLSKYVSKEEIKEEIKDVIDHNVLQNVVGSFFGELQNLEMIKRTGKIQISLLDVKEKTPVIASKLANILSDGIKTCENVDDIIEENGLPSCIPKEFSRDEFIAQVTKEINKTLESEIPEEYVFEIGEDVEQAEELYTTLFILHYLPYFLAGVLVLLALLILLVIYKPFLLGLRYMSKAGIGSGIIGLLISRSVLLIPGAIRETSEQMEYKEATLDLVEFLITKVSDKILIYSVYLLGIGLLVFIVTLFHSHKNRTL
jgi:hypothetical protein